MIQNDTKLLYKISEIGKICEKVKKVISFTTKTCKMPKIRKPCEENAKKGKYFNTKRYKIVKFREICEKMQKKYIFHYKKI